MAEQSRRSGRLTASVIMSSDMLYDLFCEVCSEDGKHLEAEGYCIDCQYYLCGDCFKGHRSTRTSRNHVLQDKTQMPQQKPSPSVAVPSTGSCTEKCARHPDRLVEYYCRDDSSLGCSFCMTVNHRLCNSVDHIPELAEQLLDSQEFKHFTDTLNSLNTKSKTVIKSTKENVIKAEKRFSDAENMLQELRKKMNEAFDKFEGDLKNKASTIKSSNLKKMQDISDKGQAVFDEVKRISAEQQRLQNKNQLGQLFIHMIKLEDKVDSLHTLLADTDNSVTAYTLELGSGVQQILDDPSSIGKLSVQATARPTLPPRTTTPAVKKPSVQAPVAQSAATATPIASSTTTPALQKSYAQPHAAPSAATAAPIAKDPQNIKVVKVTDIKVKTKSDIKECLISGSALLPGNMIILADYYNNKVKLLNLLTSKVTSDLTVSPPWDITSITADQVAVTLPDSRKIVFVKVTDTLKMDREMSVAGSCTGILHNNGKLIVSCTQPVKIEIMALDGTVERKIEQPGLFDCPSYMALSLDCKTIYVSDCDGDCVKRITLEGAVGAEYRDEELVYPRGITVDQHGRVMVCGYRSSNIHLLTPDLTKIKNNGNGPLTDIGGVSVCPGAPEEDYDEDDDEEVHFNYQAAPVQSTPPRQRRPPVETSPPRQKIQATEVPQRRHPVEASPPRQKIQAAEIPQMRQRPQTAHTPITQARRAEPTLYSSINTPQSALSSKPAGSGAKTPAKRSSGGGLGMWIKLMLIVVMAALVYLVIVNMNPSAQNKIPSRLEDSGV